MATQVIGAVRRSRMSAILIALALALVVVVLATQASSIWTTTVPQVQPVVHVSLSPQDMANIGHIRPGCRPKYGCQHEGNTGTGRP
jgi:hypothetical protein